MQTMLCMAVLIQFNLVKMTAMQGSSRARYLIVKTLCL